MRLSKTLPLALVICSFISVQTVYATSEQILQYKNQRGSTVMLILHQDKQENTGTITGTFTSAVGDCKPDVGVPLPIFGFYNSNAITITVNFPHCQQVVAMTGNIINSQNQLHTLWLDAKPVNDPQGADWNSNIIGSDLYDKMS